MAIRGSALTCFQAMVTLLRMTSKPGSSFEGTKNAHELFLHKPFEHPQGSGTSRQKSRDIPDSSLRNPRKTNFRGRARSFQPPTPFAWKTPTPPGGLRTQKVNLCALFSCRSFAGWPRNRTRNANQNQQDRFSSRRRLNRNRRNRCSGTKKGTGTVPLMRRFLLTGDGRLNFFLCYWC